MTNATVTQMIISDTGTVNANQNLSNVKLYYETAGTCTYNGNEAAFNSTGVDFNSSDVATATGTMSVGTSQVCVYVVLDVGSGASDNQTLEIQISNPSTDVTITNGSVTPATVVQISGTTTLHVVSTSTYDFSVCTPDTNCWAYEKDSVQPTSPTNYDSEALTSDYTAISSSNNSRWETALATTTGNYDSQIYSFTITQSTSSIYQIDVSWEGYGETQSGYLTSLKIWNNNSNSWDSLQSIDFTAAIDQTASGTISSNIGTYIDSNSKIHILAITQKYGGPGCQTGIYLNSATGEDCFTICALYNCNCISIGDDAGAINGTYEMYGGVPGKCNLAINRDCSAVMQSDGGTCGTTPTYWTNCNCQ
jgi:hypothetical protein